MPPPRHSLQKLQQRFPIEENAERFTQLLPFYPCTNFSIFADLSLRSEWVQNEEAPEKSEVFFTPFGFQIDVQIWRKGQEASRILSPFLCEKRKTPGPRPRGFFFLSHDVYLETGEKRHGWSEVD